MAKNKPKTIDDVTTETLVLERDELDEPKMYCVVLHNDDFTTQEFVVHILVNFFYKTQEDALRIMLKVHREGKARVGSYIKDIAETKVRLITSYSRQNNMPLLVTIEQE